MKRGKPPTRVRAISQVRFGVEMTGETDSGIVFGAEIWADDAEEGEGGQVGQVEGSVFVSGSLGHPDLSATPMRPISSGSATSPATFR